MRGVRKRTPWEERMYQEVSNRNEDGGCILEYFKNGFEQCWGGKSCHASFQREDVQCAVARGQIGKVKLA